MGCKLNQKKMILVKKVKSKIKTFVDLVIVHNIKLKLIYFIIFILLLKLTFTICEKFI